MVGSDPMEVLASPPIVAHAPQATPALRRSSRAHALPEAMLNLQRVVPDGSYSLQASVAVALGTRNVTRDAAPATDEAAIDLAVQPPAGPDELVSDDIEMESNPGTATEEPSSAQSDAASADVEMTAPAACPQLVSSSSSPRRPS